MFIIIVDIYNRRLILLVNISIADMNCNEGGDLSVEQGIKRMNANISLMYNKDTVVFSHTAT